MKLNFSVPEMISGISVYQSVQKDKLVKSFVKFFKKVNEKKRSFSEISRLYSRICNILYESEYEGSLSDYLFDKILREENQFTCFSANGQYETMPQVIRNAAEYDLAAFYALSQVTAAEMKQKIAERFPEQKELVASLGEFVNESSSFAEFAPWGENLEKVAQFHAKNGIGMFSKYYAFYLSDHQKVVPVKKFEPFALSSLKKYELQKKKITDNTLSFIHGKPANNVLLYGDRGTGKSTTVNAILNEYHTQGLRMIQVAKEDILYIDKVLKVIRAIPLRFIIFIDDLTFNENDECFNTLKAVLEGSLNAMPENVLIYATTNRRHLIKETFSSREGNELHASDTRDENASLADRFGLTITFTKPNQQDFLEIVCEIARERGLGVDEELLRKGASTFAIQKASRSGRVARQYVDYVEGRISLNLPI